MLVKRKEIYENNGESSGGKANTVAIILLRVDMRLIRQEA